MSRYPRPAHPGLVPVPAGRIGRPGMPRASLPMWVDGRPGPGRDTFSYAVAAKTYYCIACNQPILRGELHHRENWGPWSSGSEPGCSAHTWRMCEFCGPRVWEFADEEGLTEDQVWDALHSIRVKWLERLEHEGLITLPDEWEDEVLGELDGVMRADAGQWLREAEACRA